jgi:hypothetical protein
MGLNLILTINFDFSIVPIIIGKPKISYSALKQLCSIEGLGNR